MQLKNIVVNVYVIIVNNIISMIIFFLVSPKVKLAISVIEPYGDNIYISAVTQNIIVTQFFCDKNTLEKELLSRFAV